MDIQNLRASFSGRLYTDPTETAPFLTDWRRKWTGQAIAVAQPETTQGVSAVVRWCQAHGVAVVPQGGNTGLSGGATPGASGRSLVLSLARLNRVRGVDAVNNTMAVEAGVTLQQVQAAAEDAGRYFPLSLAAEGTCTIGGNLATNAGGVQVLRYGNARELCLGLEVVTPTGDIWDGLRGLRKDNTGYDLRDLYIGSEGTLGVITAAVLKTWPQPKARIASFIAVPSPESAVQLLALAQDQLASQLTAFELMDDTCVSLVEKHIGSVRLPLADRSPWYVLLEVSHSTSEAQAIGALESVLEAVLERGWATDAVLSSSVAQFRNLWALRENISEAQGAEGPTIKHDIALPISRVAHFVQQVSPAIQSGFPGACPVIFGHLGDGNLHFNVSPPLGCEPSVFALWEEPLNRLVHDAVDAAHGSISAEHGLGVLRRDESSRYKSAVELGLMSALKHALDPHGLMNPGKVLPLG